MGFCDETRFIHKLENNKKQEKYLFLTLYFSDYFRRIANFKNSLR